MHSRLPPFARDHQKLAASRRGWYAESLSYAIRYVQDVRKCGKYVRGEIIGVFPELLRQTTVSACKPDDLEFEDQIVENQVIIGCYTVHS
ncbi:hypothetical protein K443DRAFT_318099 [Laccaria amethystina LaAM-08-1]|uniref:Uncharacterized protein n=1 Tax=Laccaria amethystina LaAM-08-1 TaxID=1095629 RepID=A0A0C9X1G5_9AGAR|nr:hypothetical protein K443DRAFT_318099 [Laccaria amethystina LaAM-08-1]